MAQKLILQAVLMACVIVGVAIGISFLIPILFDDAKLLVKPIWSWPVVISVAIALIAFICLTYPQRVKHLAKPWPSVLVGLRVMTVLLILFSVLRPEVRTSVVDTKSAVMILLLDSSRSMQTEDGPGGISRRKALIQTLLKCEPSLKELSEDLDIRIYNFDQELRPVEKPGEEAEGKQTAIGETLEQLLRESQTQRIVSVILMSDGAQRALSPIDGDPRMIAQRLGDLQVPIFTVGYGGSGLNQSTLDLAVESISVEQIVFEKKAVPVEAIIRLTGAAGRRVKVQLLVEELVGPRGTGRMVIPLASRNAIPSRIITTNENSHVEKVTLSYEPQVAGEFKIRVEVVPLDGEIRIRNNHQETLITVQKGGIKVAYIDKLRSEMRAVQMLVGSKQIQLNTFWVRSGAFETLTKIDPKIFSRGQYDVYILGDVPAKVFEKQGLLKQLARRVDEGAGLIMTGGFRSFGAGGYAETALADKLPVAMNASERELDDTSIDPDLHIMGDLQMIPTPAGLRHYVMQMTPLSESTNRERWLEFPPLSGASKLTPKNAFVEVLARAEDGTPLLMSAVGGKSRVMAFAGDSTFLWFQHGFKDETVRFWRQIVFWLARKELDSDKAVWVRVEPRTFSQSAHVSMTFGGRDEDGRPITDVDFTVSVTAPDGKVYPVAPQRNGNFFSGDFINTDKPGDYWANVNATRAGKPFGLPAVTRFLVGERDLELDNPAADLTLLKDIAETTGGTRIPAEELNSYFERLIDEKSLLTEETIISETTLWDNLWFVGIFVLLISTEWLVRKTKGLV